MISHTLIPRTKWISSALASYRALEKISSTSSTMGISLISISIGNIQKVEDGEEVLNRLKLCDDRRNKKETEEDFL
ncbi:hypothetical protein M5689_011249 [Euphorbia peplus]|nr:hypothetical protein M5689_011249 [Euphorbia peplus]